MPVVGIPVQLLLERIKTPLTREQLVEHLQHLGCDVEGYAVMRRFACKRCDSVIEITESENPPVVCERCSADYKQEPALLLDLGTSEAIRMEQLAVRPDMFDPGGLARVLRHYLGEEAEPSTYEIKKAQWSVAVDSSVSSGECQRPFIACAIVRNISLSDELIKVVMKLQENLHWALGRNRKHASVGVYDLDTLQGPQIKYRTVGPQELRFCPLGFDPKRAEHQITPAQILSEHLKGKAYAKLLADFRRYPLLQDGQGQVLSLPPIINSEETRVRKTTRNFFIDVTGTGERIVNKALNVLVTSLAELDKNVQIEQVQVRYADGREVATPDLTPQIVQLDVRTTAETIGVKLDGAAILKLLRKMGHRAHLDGANITVQVPAYRNDIMHPIDLIEDVAIAYGYHNITPLLVPTMTVGAERPMERHMNTVRRSLSGLGYFETMTLILSSAEQNYDALRQDQSEEAVLIENPISVEQTMIRTTLIAGMMDTFSINTNHEMPQRIFEVGNVTLLDKNIETGAREVMKVAAGTTGPKADYSEIRATAASLLREFGWSLATVADCNPLFIEGRAARILACRGEQTKPIGIIGEVHPEVLERFNLVQPAAVMELDLAALIECGQTGTN